MKNFIVVGLILLALTIPPGYVQASTFESDAYNTMSVNEKIAFLYGMIVQLQIDLELLLESELRSGDSRDRSQIDVETRSATDIEEDEAELRGEIDLNREDEALVWFEYGEDDDLDERTTKRRITDSRGDDVDISAIIDDLDDDERYYFRAVAEDENGDRSYGSIRNFTTDDDRNDDDDDDRDRDNDRGEDEFDLEVDDTSVAVGDFVTIEWELPEDYEGTQNWIGLYETRSDNRSFETWQYLTYRDSGSVTFEMEDRGEFEFRLFLDNNYNDVATSREVDVR